MGILYFDNNATTKIGEQVLADMLPYLHNAYGNASSIQHTLGRQANQAISKARQQVADFLKVKENEIIFTSGATEAINMVLSGIAETYKSKGNHLISCNTEHKAVLSTLQTLEKKGSKVSYLGVNKQGEIDLENLRQSITDQTVLVAIMAANNETGVIHPIKEIAEICTAKNVLFFCDATQ
ncbi:MAG: cysteine desulfurase family protein, partial [Sphingobacterium sp.]